MKTIAALLAICITVSGCAVSSRAVTTSQVPHTNYRHYDCEMLFNESDRLSARVSNLAGRIDEAAANDAALVAVSALLFWPAIFAIGNKSQEAEYSYLKGQHDAVQQATVFKKCPGITPTGMTSASVPAK